MISVEEYRKLMDDQTSSDELVVKRIQFLDVFCRNIIRAELEKYKKDTNSVSTKDSKDTLK